MKITIEDGKTIISTGIGADHIKNKTGVKGMHFGKRCGSYRLEIVHGGRKYHIGNYATIEEGKAMRKKADEHIENGTFDLWVQNYVKKRVVNKLGVKGLYQKGNVYQLVISHKQIKYFLGSFAVPEAAKPVREEAVRRIEDGTFLDWIAELKKERENNNNKN